jgi:hypothetical protein
VGDVTFEAEEELLIAVNIAEEEIEGMQQGGRGDGRWG